MDGLCRSNSDAMRKTLVVSPKSFHVDRWAKVIKQSVELKDCLKGMLFRRRSEHMRLWDEALKMKRMALTVFLISAILLLFCGCAGQSPASGILNAFGSGDGDRAGASGAEQVRKRSSAEERILTNSIMPRFFVGTVRLVKGDEKEFPQYRLWAALEFDEPIKYKDSTVGELELDRIQLGPVATDGRDQDYWRQYEGQRVVVEGNVKGQTWNFWHLTPCSVEDAVVIGSGEARRSQRRDEVVEGFVTETYTNYHLENGEYVHETRDYKPYVSPTSELYEWKDGNDDGEEVLMVGNPVRVESVDVLEVVGDAYIVDIYECALQEPTMDEVRHVSTMAIVLGDDDLVQHAYC